VLLLDLVDLLQGLDPDVPPVGAALGVVFEDVGDGRGAAADDLLEQGVIDQVRGGLEAVDGAAEELVAVEGEGGYRGGERLDRGGGGGEDGALLREDVGCGGDFVGAFVEFEP